MDVNAITVKTHRVTHTDNSTYPDANILADLVLLDAEMIAYVLKVQGYREVNGKEVYSDLISTTGLNKGDSGYNGEYSFPLDFLKLKRIEVKFTGADSLPTVIYDPSGNTSSEYETPSDNFDTSNPNIRFDHGSYFIRPLPTATVLGGIHIWYEKRQAALSSGSDIPSLEPSFHRIYPLLLAKEYSQENPDKYNKLWDDEIAKILREIANFYRTKFRFKKELSTQFISFK